MSHGGGGGEGVEVNLIPMIDIIIQLICFFLMLTNFDNSNKDERIRLPIADLAKPTDVDIDEPLILNVNAEGLANMVGELVDVESSTFRRMMEFEAQSALKNMKAHGKEAELSGGRPKLWTTILIRADKSVEYGKIQKMMKACQDLGFYKFALRASPAKESM